VWCWVKLRPVLVSPAQSCHDERVATPDLQRLAERIAARRKRLGLSVRRAAAAAGISKDTWTRLENAQSVWQSTYDAIEPVLGWTAGSCRKIIDGGEAAYLDEAEPGQITPVPPQVLETEIRAAVQGALISSTDELTTAQVREVNDKAIAALRDAGILPPAD
jgi:transcriptional regulator with XRE-family HTH domain